MNTHTLLRRVILLIVVSLITAACEWATPARVHEWDASPVLLMLHEGADPMTYLDYAHSRTPELVLYADGRVIVTRYDHNAETRSIGEARLSPDDVCAMLIRIESFGFFDYDMEDYKPPEITDQNTPSIIVNAWRSKWVAAYALGSVRLYYALDRSKIPAALVDTHEYLSSLEPPNATPYYPEHVVLYIRPLERSSTESWWPLAAPSLAQLAGSQKNDDDGVALEGEEAAQIYTLFGSKLIKVYNEGGVTYRLALRPQYPYQTGEFVDAQDGISPFSNTPTTRLACNGNGKAVHPANLTP